MSKRFKAFSVLSILMLGMLLIITNSCEKSDREEDTETVSARDNALAYHVFDDIWREVHRVAMQDTLLGYYDSNLIRRPQTCIRTILISDTLPIFPLFVRINYSDDGEICNDGFERFGVITANFTSRYITPGSVITIGLDGYRKDDYDVDGTITLTNLGFENDQMVFQMQVTEGAISGNNINITWEGTHTYTWVQGNSTFSSLFDDIFLIEGFASGNNSRGNDFFNEITFPYRADFSCQWYTEGRSELTLPNLPTRIINYDDADECNNLLIARRFNTYPIVEIPY